MKKGDTDYVYYEYKRIYTKGSNITNPKLVLAAYSIISEDNSGQYHPDYAYNHPLFSNDMHIYSVPKVSDLLQFMTAEISAG